MSRRHTHKNQTPASSSARAKKAQDLWHRIPERKRVGALLCTTVILFGFLYSLKFSSASTGTGGTVLEVVVTIGDQFTVNLIAIPEKRVRILSGQDNSGTLLAVEVRNPGETSPLFSQSVVTSSGGTYTGLNVTLVPGTYDITAKGYSHLRRKNSSAVLDNGVTVDFTNNGASPLLCGDTDDNNKVNGLDLSLLVGGLATYNLKYDMDRNGVINGLDLTHTVSNINLTGAT